MRSEQNNRVIHTRDLIIRRHFKASPTRLFSAWTSPNDLMRWWGPLGFTAPVFKIDLRVDGDYHYCTRSSLGEEFWCAGKFIEVLMNRRIVLADSFSDASGRILSPSTVGLPAHWPSTLMISVTFEANLEGTNLTLLHESLPLEMVSSCRAGWLESFNKLDLILERTSE